MPLLGALSLLIDDADELQSVNDVALVLRREAKLLHRLGRDGRREVLAQIRDHLRDVSRAGNIRM